MSTSETDRLTSLKLASEIVSSYVSRNSLPAAELPALITSVHSTLRALSTGSIAALTEQTAAPEPRVPIRKSVTPDYIVCLDDGLKFKSLRRHLSGLGMTPEQYREKWKLPADYPMVAPNYAAVRSELAKKSGLGQLRAAVVETKRVRPRKAAA